MSHIVRVTSARDETATVRTLEFDDSTMAAALPGQFAMVWVPGIGEIPMSVMVADGGRAAFTVRRHGTATTGLYNLGPGDMMGVRGPYGNSFDIRAGRLLLVGGGTGLVPLIRLIYRAPPDADITLVMGARTRPEVLFADTARTMLRPRPHCMVVCTDDGSYGRPGLATDAAADEISGGAFDAVYACGPEIMMYKVMRLALDAGVFAQASVERIMKCGTGICGSCCMGRELVCGDGTVFEAGRLLANPDFGVRYRTKSGEVAYY